MTDTTEQLSNENRNMRHELLAMASSLDQMSVKIARLTSERDEARAAVAALREALDFADEIMDAYTSWIEEVGKWPISDAACLSQLHNDRNLLGIDNRDLLHRMSGANIARGHLTTKALNDMRELRAEMSVRGAGIGGSMKESSEETRPFWAADCGESWVRCDSKAAALAESSQYLNRPHAMLLRRWTLAELIKRNACELHLDGDSLAEELREDPDAYDQFWNAEADPLGDHIGEDEMVAIGEAGLRAMMAKANELKLMCDVCETLEHAYGENQ